MDSNAFSAATQGLLNARRDARRIEPLPAAWAPEDLTTAYRMQRAVARPLGAVRGWKISALTDAQAHAMQVPGPVAGPLLAPFVQQSAARYSLSHFVAPLLEGEFAHAMPNSENPQDGFKIYIHPFFSLQLARVPHMVFYQLVRVNYGEFASPADAEVFGASALGLSQDAYYETLCEIADEISGEPA